MAVEYEVFEVNALVVCVGGEKVSYQTTKGGEDFSILKINDTAIKLSKQNVQDLKEMLRAGEFRVNNVK